MALELGFVARESTEPICHKKFNKQPNKMMSRRLFLIVASALALATNAQDYGDYQQDYEQDYSQDGLYADYARQQQAKEVAAEA